MGMGRFYHEMEMLTKCIALELATYNIQANSIIVGGIATELTPPERHR